MRNVPNRKLNREPVRSPSPDIANRNIIVHTHRPQTADILNKSRTKYSDSAKSVVPLHFEDIQRSLIDTQQKYRELEKQLTLLLIENSNIKKQNNELKDLLAKNKPSFLKPYDQIQNESTLKEYQTRFVRYSQEIKRIHQLLRREKQRNEQLEAQIAGLKKYDLVYSLKLNKNMHEEVPFNNYMHEEVPFNNLRLIEQNLNEQFEKIKAEHELRVHVSLNAINQRLAKIERSQNNIHNTVRPEYQTPKTNKQHDRYDYSTASIYDYSTASHYITNSNQIKKFHRSGKQTQEQRQIDMLRDKLRMNQLDYESVKRQNEKLTAQLQHQKEKSSLVGECQRCKLYQIRITELERQLEKIIVMKNQMTLLQDKVDGLVKDNTALKNVDDLNKIYRARIEQLQTHNHNQQLQRHNHNQTHQSELIRRQQTHQSELIRRQQTHQSELIRRQQKINFNFQDYLRRIKDVKNILNNQEFRQFLQKIHLLVTQNTHLQTQLSKMIQENQRNPKQNKNREIELRLLVSQLKRQNSLLKVQNSLLKVQNQQQQHQIEQLRHIIEEQFKKPSQQHLSLQTQLQQIQSVQPEAAKFKLYLSQAISRLQSMQNSINMML